MDEVTLGELAEMQAARHPVGTPGARRRPRSVTSDFPLVASGRAYNPYLAEAEGDGVEDVPVLTPAAFGDFAIRVGRLKTKRMRTDGGTSAAVSAGRLAEGDVVMSLTPPFQVALVGTGAGAYVPTQFAVIRMDDETRAVLDPAYLAGWLSTADVRETLLAPKVEGRVLHLSELLTVPVPLPEIGVQRELGDVLRAAARIEVDRWEASDREVAAVGSLFGRATRGESR